MMHLTQKTQKEAQELRPRIPSIRLQQGDGPTSADTTMRLSPLSHIFSEYSDLFILSLARYISVEVLFNPKHSACMTLLGAIYPEKNTKSASMISMLWMSSLAIIQIRIELFTISVVPSAHRVFICHERIHSWQQQLSKSKSYRSPVQTLTFVRRRRKGGVLYLLADLS